MVDDCPPTLLPHHPLLSASPPPELHGVAGLAPQFDRAISTPRRSVPPIGSLSPQSRSFALPALQPHHQAPHPLHHFVNAQHAAAGQPQSLPHHNPHIRHNPHHHPNPLPQKHLPAHHSLAVSPPIPAADFLAECTHAADRATYPHSAPPRQHHPPLEFDLFGLSSLDLGPPVLHTRFPQSPPLNSPPPHLHERDQAALAQSPVFTSLASQLSQQPQASPPAPPQQAQPPAQPPLPAPPVSPPPTSRAFFPPGQPLPGPPELQPLTLSQPAVQPSLAQADAVPHAPQQTATSPIAVQPRQPTSPSHTPSASPAAPPPRAREPAHPTRSVLLRNIPPGVDDDDIRTLLAQFGPLRDLGAQHRARGGRGSVLATYYDLRHARAAVRALDTAVHFGRRLDARFQQQATSPTDGAPSATGANGAGPTAPAKGGATTTAAGTNGASQPVSADAPSQNHGTLVVFNLDLSTSADDVRALFSSVGDVKEIRATPNKKHHKFVEFYDVRDAERAMLLLNKTEVAGKRIKIEISRPGGRAGSQARALGMAPQPQGVQVQQQKAGSPSAKQPAPVPAQISADSLGTAQRRLHNETPVTSVGFTPSSYPPPSLAHRIVSNQTQFDPALQTRLDAAVQEDAPVGSAPVPVPTPNGRGGLCSPTSSAVFSLEDKGALGSPPADALLSPFIARPVVQQLRSLPQQTHTKPAPDSYIQALYNSPPSDGGRGRLSASPKSAVASPPRRTHASDGNGQSRSTSDGESPRSGRHGHGASRHGGSPPGGAKGGAGGGHGGHGSNGKFLLDIGKVRGGDETRTALMIRNIPNKYNQKMLLSTLEEGHKGHFDFIYLPIDFKNKCNVGYAFINFTKPEFIEAFYHEFHGKKWGRFNSEKVCEITFARIQGRQQLIAHFQNSSLLLEDPKCRPVIFDCKGRQEEFPVGSHVRTRRGPSNRDAGHRGCESSPPFSPPKHRGRA